MSDGNQAVNFFVWLAETHPGVKLTAMQEEWVNLKIAVRGSEPVWVGGRASGYTFVKNLWDEYCAR